LIEKIIGRQFSMDALEDNPTPRRLTAALDQQSDATCGNVSSARVPLVFLMSPAGGDSPVLARFRAGFKGNIRFTVIEYPGWRQMTEDGAGIGLLAEAAVAQIRAQSGDGDICLLAGYSFGGLVAVEAARRLAELGHRIGFLGLIDTTATNTPTPSPPTRWHKIVSALILMSAFRTLRIIGQSSKLLPSKQAFTLEFILGERLRAMSVRRWKFGPAPVPITLYRSDDGAPLDKGWSATGSRVMVVPIGGNHQSMLESPFLDILCERFVEAVDNAFEDAGSRPLV
jgi:thioesterase domain-containing protein